MRNMVSLALAGLITKFFYSGPFALGNLFPEVFACKVPRSVMCLAATAVSIGFLISKYSLFYSCEWLLTSIHSQGFDRTTSLNSLPT